MEWEEQSEALLKRVPFFVRKMVRRKVEQFASDLGIEVITPEIVTAAKETEARGLSPLSPTSQDDRFFVMRRIEGIPADQGSIPMYEVDACHADEVGCPMSVNEGGGLVDQVRSILEASGITQFILRSTTGPLLPHHRFKVSISSCPNACSQPQIKDMGLIAQLKPEVVDDTCSQCGECIDTCREDALTLRGDDGIALDNGLCLYCGQCIQACPTGTLEQDARGFALYLGGRLGRHPRLADKVANLLSTQDVLRAVERIVAYTIHNARPGERFSQLVERVGPDTFAAVIGLPSGRQGA